MALIEASYYEANDPGEDGLFSQLQDDTTIVGVVDGHGGRLAASYAEQHLPQLVASSVSSSDDQTAVIRALHVSLLWMPARAPLIPFLPFSVHSKPATSSSLPRCRRTCACKRATSTPGVALC